MTVFDALDVTYDSAFVSFDGLPVEPEPTLIVEFGFSVPVGVAYLYLDDTARGRLGTGLLAPDGLWVDVTDHVMSVRIDRGTQRFDGPTLRTEAGRCTVTLKDTDRRYDPTNLSGPYVSVGVSQIRPMLPVRVRATSAGITYPLFLGFVDSWNITYPQAPTAFVDVPCTDAIKTLAAVTRTVASPTGASEDAGARVNRILDGIGWPATDRVVATGDTTMQATTLAGNAWTELLLTADSEIGDIYIDAAGRIVFRNRHAPLTEPRAATSQAVFGDGGGAELPYSGITQSYDDVQLRNQIRATRTGGAQQTAEDTVSQARYLTHTWEKSDLLLEADPDALTYAQYVLYQNTEPELRFESLQVLPQAEPFRLFPQALGRELGDRLTVIRRPPGGGTITRDVFIRGVSHLIEPDRWETRWTFQSATKHAFFVLDNASLGQLDANALAA